MIQASAPSKVILFGEHAVVHGQPAIAVPVSGLRAYATVEPNPADRSGLCIAADLAGHNPIPVTSNQIDNAIALTAQLTLRALDAVPPDVTIRIHSEIPVASGLGSGAAVSTALARALCMAIGKPLDNAALNQVIYEVEKIHHGTPSGIDNTVIVYERPVYFIKNERLEPFSPRMPFHLLIGDTGIGASTRIAVSAVRELVLAQPDVYKPVLSEIGAITDAARTAIDSGDINALGALMPRNHALLQQLTVSSPELDQLVSAALDAGALGAKMSGGGRGGNMIALVTSGTQSAVEAALRDAGAARVFATTVN
jgi:mevalonate kinase